MKARVLALYLPQYHPIPENDEWWGKGFTEWTNVGKAKKYFRGHYQPRVPADLGYYDLRVAETRQAQADMARKYGVEGFLYWHYWFGNGKRLIERPFNEVLASGEPDFPFALAWANESWKGFSHGITNRNVLIEQQYMGVEDYIAHFYAVLPAFKDRRYITVDGKPFFMIYKPMADPQVVVFIETWRKLAVENGLTGIYFVGHAIDKNVTNEEILSTGCDAINSIHLSDYLYRRSLLQKVRDRLRRILFNRPNSYPYQAMKRFFLDKNTDQIENIFPTIIPGWDHTPRSGKHGMVMTNATPAEFEDHVREAVAFVQHKTTEHRIIIVKSWNEWAEGNYLEPDLKYGTKFLEAFARQMK